MLLRVHFGPWNAAPGCPGAGPDSAVGNRISVVAVRWSLRGPCPAGATASRHGRFSWGVPPPQMRSAMFEGSSCKHGRWAGSGPSARSGRAHTSWRENRVTQACPASHLDHGVVEALDVLQQALVVVGHKVDGHTLQHGHGRRRERVAGRGVEAAVAHEPSPIAALPAWRSPCDRSDRSGRCGGGSSRGYWADRS